LLIADMPPAFEKSLPILGKGYLSRGVDDSLVVGTTYENDFSSDEPCEEVAKDKILSKIEQFIELEEPLVIRQVRSAVRCVHNSHYFPIAKKISKREYVIGAMGSRGLLYHGLLGKQIADLIQAEENVASV
ncbi:MAG: hypothetical protein JKX98_09650, partial [Alcanivoracaceae bacterium]|nr:hypothetical protein [Alcanivoracaceae bacterium]